MRIRLLCVVAIVLLFAAGVAGAEQQGLPSGQTSRPQLVTPLSNEISFYRNMDDVRRPRGVTLQIISINQFHIGTDFIIEFTGDFNWEMDLNPEAELEKAHDYYLELSIVKPVYRSLSVNYQRIYGTFANGPINQFGIRLSLFSGS